MKDTHKLNESDRTIRERLAGIAIIALQNIHQQGGLTEEQLLDVINLSERLTKTALYIHSGEDEDQAGIRQCINLIEDYLKEQGV